MDGGRAREIVAQAPKKFSNKYNNSNSARKGGRKERWMGGWAEYNQQSVT